MPDLVRLRNVSRDDLTVAPLGNRRVEADCVVDIPRDIFERYAWPTTVWRDETPAKRSTTTEKG